MINAILFAFYAKSYAMTAFNDLLGLFQLDVSVYHNARICGDWNLSAGATGATCFHMPTQGDCILDVPTIGTWHLNEGDLVIFPYELEHTMRPVEKLQGEQQHLPIGESQSLNGTSMLCGVVKSMHRSGHHLMSVLPAVLVVSGDIPKRWLTPLTELILLESLNNDHLDSPILKRLSELLFAYSLQCYAANYEHKIGVLALYSHPRLAPAIQSIHKSPELAWQIASLAEQCAMSRTQFAKLFTKTSGYTVIQYLTWWRMQLAWSKLRGGATVEQTAEDAGYRSIAAFSRAFKTAFGETVGSVRNMNR
jgi:AraC-like DNA-binding protein